jgi:hypothetical protein
LQGAVDGSSGGLQELGDLSGPEAEHICEQERRALPGRKVLKRRDEGELDGLALLVARPGLMIGRQPR